MDISVNGGQGAHKHTRALLLYTKGLDGSLEISLRALDFLLTEDLLQSKKQFVIRNKSRSEFCMEWHLHLYDRMKEGPYRFSTG